MAVQEKEGKIAFRGFFTVGTRTLLAFPVDITHAVVENLEDGYGDADFIMEELEKMYYGERNAVDDVDFGAYVSVDEDKVEVDECDNFDPHYVRFVVPAEFDAGRFAADHGLEPLAEREEKE